MLRSLQTLFPPFGFVAEGFQMQKWWKMRHFTKCKRCRLDKCFVVGMNPRNVCGINFIGSERVAPKTEQTELESPEIDMNFGETTTDHNNAETTKWAETDSPLVQKNFAGFIFMKNLLEVEQKVQGIRKSSSKSNSTLIACADRFSTQVPSPPSEMFYEIIRQTGPFCKMPPYLAMDLLFVFEIGKTFPFFQRLSISDKIALSSNISAPLLMLSNGFYSVQQNSDINCGAAAGARRYVELMALIEFAFNSGAKHRELLTYVSNVLDPQFDLVMPPVLAKVCTNGPVELHQLLPY
ncbi:hypothetical protein niasHT_032125 [Heterodera trifolii]|uniref:Nuclear receptor domain-containing protein n=1 Tax=Heterodera trifolii TaxID=157864 RepID=A0ABD2HP94_9BILA